jgi:hypothetical protein
MKTQQVQVFESLVVLELNKFVRVWLRDLLFRAPNCNRDPEVL